MHKVQKEHIIKIDLLIKEKNKIIYQDRIEWDLYNDESE